MKYFKWIVTASGAIALAAAGEAVWEVVVKPAFPQMLNVIVWISTLGMDSLQDNIYREIGIGSYERTSLQIYVVMCELMILSGIFLIPLVLKARRRIDSIVSGISKDKNDVSLNNIATAAARLKKTSTYLLASSFAAAIIAFVVGVFSIASSVYEVRAEANIRQIIRIDSAFVDDKVLKSLESQAAQIKNKKDYETLIKKLRKISLDNKIDPPLFNVM